MTLHLRNMSDCYVFSVLMQMMFEFLPLTSIFYFPTSASVRWENNNEQKNNLKFALRLSPSLNAKNGTGCVPPFW
eukprot:g4444.t1